jgi:hypothetical protein
MLCRPYLHYLRRGHESFFPGHLGVMGIIGVIKKIFLMRWLWGIFAGFYLVAYVFWVPAISDRLLFVVLVASLTLILGSSLLVDGFSRALELEYKEGLPALPFKRAREALGALLLFGYLLVYLPPGGRIVAHWPLDMAITLLAGVIVLVYAIWDIG